MRQALNIMLVHARLFQLFNCVSQLNYEMAMNIERERDRERVELWCFETVCGVCSEIPWKVWWHMPQPNWSLWHLFGTVDLLRQTLWEVPACGCHVVRVNLRVTCPDLSTENCLLMIVHDKFITCFFLECPRRSLIICVMSTIVLLLFC